MKNKIYDQVKQMSHDNHKEFVQAIIRLEHGVTDQDLLDEIYKYYLKHDGGITSIAEIIEYRFL